MGDLTLGPCTGPGLKIPRPLGVDLGPELLLALDLPLPSGADLLLRNIAGRAIGAVHDRVEN